MQRGYGCLDVWIWASPPLPRTTTGDSTAIHRLWIIASSPSRSPPKGRSLPIPKTMRKVTLPFLQRSRYLSSKGHATFPPKVRLPTGKRSHYRLPKGHVTFQNLCPEKTSPLPSSYESLWILPFEGYSSHVLIPSKIQIFSPNLATLDYDDRVQVVWPCFIGE